VAKCRARQAELIGPQDAKQQEERHEEDLSVVLSSVAREAGSVE